MRVRHSALALKLILLTLSILSFNQAIANPGSDKQYSGSFSASVVSMKWIGFPFGTVVSHGGERKMMRKDFAALQFVVNKKNRVKKTGSESIFHRY
jgi:hypothetical protein